MRVLFKKLIADRELEQTGVFRSRTQLVLLADAEDVYEQYRECIEKVLDSVSKFTREGSGWTVNGIVAVEVHLIKYRPLAGSSFVPTPKKLLLKKAIVNVQNLMDDKCFL